MHTVTVFTGNKAVKNENIKVPFCLLELFFALDGPRGRFSMEKSVTQSARRISFM
jgi:hypothetical protein